ncbi:helix-turn-helix domain-containing protein [Ktedonobacter racemifer]|uniref:DNA binding domain protein, excisionase family n=1 Tax=Ktedonobacter racemifer DSM 44963 TaxID=485913 RepID=D6TES3_KTERA|nr:helix-turn-helix domain-containing protein [Ktedonobacter racemifer]EFH88522.1 DNA binding domain protein, excisionase family [Ktedonobacter racemifer DSM 44963]
MEEFYTLQEIADMLKIHIETVRELVRKKELPAIKASRRDYRVRRSAFEEFLRKRSTTGDDN